MNRRVGTALLIVALVTSACDSSGSTPQADAPSPVDITRCGPTLVGLHDHVGDTRTYRRTGAARATFTEVFEGERGDAFAFRRSGTDGLTQNDTYRVDECAVTLPDRSRTTAAGATGTITGLTLPPLAAAAKPASRKGEFRLRQGDRTHDLPVALTVHTRGTKLVTTPAGRFETRRVDLEYVIELGAKTLTENVRYYLAAGVGVVTADLTSSAAGMKDRTVHDELTKIHRA